jgi:hypothetical protein
VEEEEEEEEGPWKMAWRGTRQREERGQGMDEGWMDVDLNGMGWDWDDGS